MHSPHFKNLTERQAEVLAFILDFMHRHRFAPSYREIAAHFDISLNGVAAHLAALQRKGYLELTSGTARAIMPTHLARYGCDSAEQSVLLAIARHCLMNGRMPTSRELAELLSLDEATVIQHLRQLKDLGYIDWAPRRSRSVRFLNAAWPLLSSLA